MGKENNGYIAVNFRKEKDTHPDYSGVINVAGTEYWLSGWKREKVGDDGKARKYLSLAVKPKQGQQQSHEQPTSDSELPF